MCGSAPAQTTGGISVNSSGIDGDRTSVPHSIPGNGRHVLFSSKATNLVFGDNNGSGDIFVRDRLLAEAARVSVTRGGVEGDCSRKCPVLSAGGRYVVYWSEASMLVTSDNNDAWDAFVHDRGSGALTDSILLTGPFEAGQGTSMELNWYAAPPGSAYWLAWSPNLNGSILNGHLLGIGDPMTLLSYGRNSPEGSGSSMSAPIPANAVGTTIYCEVASQEASGLSFGSNVLATFVR